ncbi:MAG TPA: uracil-DNA glycosylase [Burkholderiales bacterium]|nr:uracil-DNA glycosylase [Burkholderiales bacterium]
MPVFSIACRLCPRLARHLDRVRTGYPAYYALPVPSFGVRRPQLLIVGLAPGLHGANRTGRPFTGDAAGILLYETLHRFGLADRARSAEASDGLQLRYCRVTNAVKCLPPENKPTPAEIRRCNPYLGDEIAALADGAAILALGVVAHGAVLMALGIRRSACVFRHGARHELPRGLVLYDSYHCSRYNTQTGRLTPQMFRSVFAAIVEHLSSDIRAEHRAVSRKRRVTRPTAGGR